METNGIIIMVLWIVIFVLTIIGIVSVVNEKKKLAWACLFLIIIAFLVNVGYSIYLLHIDFHQKWVASTIAGIIIGLIVIWNTGSYLLKDKPVVIPVVNIGKYENSINV
jgi:hypothetical protein